MQRTFNILLLVTFGAVLSTTNAAFDAVVWSSSKAMSEKPVADIMASSSASSPVVVYALDGFSLATFSQKIGAYSSEPKNSQLSANIRNSAGVASQSIDGPVQVPTDSIVQSAEQIAGKPLVVFELKSWEEFEDLEPKVAQHLGKSSGYTSILSSKNAFSTTPVEIRKKRVSVSSDVNFDEEEEAAANKQKQSKAKQNLASKFAKAANVKSLPMPVVLPPVNISGSGFQPQPNDICLLYLEAVNIVVANTYMNDQPTFRNLVIGAENGTNTFDWDPTYVTCNVDNSTVGTAKFQIHINVMKDMVALYDKVPVFQIKAGQKLAFELEFNGTYLHYWKLERLTMLEDLTISNVENGVFLTGDFVLPAHANTTGVRYMGVESFYQYAYACSATQAAFMIVNKNYMVGIGLNNIEVDLKAYRIGNKMLAFNRDVYDCVGTFSVGSWMGIICSVVLASILMFGYLMLQSVQTMDRFDDPKQKQIVINFRE